jgi:hypothetical protein
VLFPQQYTAVSMSTAQVFFRLALIDLIIGPRSIPACADAVAMTPAVFPKPPPVAES